MRETCISNERHYASKTALGCPKHQSKCKNDSPRRNNWHFEMLVPLDLKLYGKFQYRTNFSLNYAEFSAFCPSHWVAVWARPSRLGFSIESTRVILLEDQVDSDDSSVNLSRLRLGLIESLPSPVSLPIQPWSIQHSIIDSFQDEDSKRQIVKSLAEPSLCDLLIKWLERVPGLEPEGFNFPRRYAEAVHTFLLDEAATLEEESDPEKRKGILAEIKKQKDTFESLLNERQHNERVRQNERRLSYGAFMGALMISCYSETPRFHLPHQLLTVNYLLCE